MKRSRLLFAASLLAVVGTAYAAVLTISWTNATQNTDGTSIPASGEGSLTATEVEYGKCNAAKDAIETVSGTITKAASLNSTPTPDLPPGTWCAHARHTNTYGVQSDWSSVAVKVIDAPKPKPPSNFSFG